MALLAPPNSPRCDPRCVRPRGFGLLRPGYGLLWTIRMDRSRAGSPPFTTLHRGSPPCRPPASGPAGCGGRPDRATSSGRGCRKVRTGISSVSQNFDSVVSHRQRGPPWCYRRRRAVTRVTRRLERRTAASGRVGGRGGHHLASTTAAWAARGIRGIHGDCSARQPGASAGPRRVAERARRDPADVPSRALARGGLRGTIRLLSVTDEGHRASEHDQRLVCSTHHCTKLSSSMEPCWCGSSRRMAAMCTRSSSGA